MVLGVVVDVRVIELMVVVLWLTQVYAYRALQTQRQRIARTELPKHKAPHTPRVTLPNAGNPEV